MVKITLLNSNMWLLPPPSAIDNNKRLDKLIKFIKKTKPDVINLQEIWLKQYAARIKKELSEYHFVSPSKMMIYHQSGLVTLLKEKPMKSEFIKHTVTKDFNAVERFANKGMLISSFEKGGHIISVINTHIHDTRDISKYKIAIKQTEELIKKAILHNPTIVSGDFNMPFDTLKHILKPFKLGTDTSETYSPNNPYTKKGLEYIRNMEHIHLTRPDYVFANLNGMKGAKIESKVITKPLLADHYSITAIITLPDVKIKNIAKPQKIRGRKRKKIKKLVKKMLRKK